MSRVRFNRGLQTKFLLSIKDDLELDWSQLARKVNVHPRSMSDWYRGRFTLPEIVFNKLAKLSVDIRPYRKFIIIPDDWHIQRAAQKGGRVTAKKYGGPGTPAGRRKGGINSQRQRRFHPELFQHCSLRKEIARPRHCKELAELFGIILGDGGINSDHQVVITLHRTHDYEFSKFVRQLANNLFAIETKCYLRKGLHKENVREVVLGGINIVEFMLSRGFLKGNKVRHQIDVPDWIKMSETFSLYCLRGLIDTDGGVFYHRHRVGGRPYLNIGIQFSNHSKPLLKFVESTLSNLGFSPKIAERYVNLYKEGDVFRYAREVRFHNPYHLRQIKQFIKHKKKNIRRDARAA